LLRPTVAEKQLLRELARQFTGIGTGNRDRILHVSLALLHLLLSRKEIRWQTGMPTEGLQRTIRQMQTHPAAALKLEELARMAGLSVRGFAKAFKRHQGVTPGRYLTQMRVRHAAELLVHSDASLELIAEKTGFANRHYLSRVFKQVTGDSPAHFRSQHKGD
jgi:transcriptional regulator GlxA family with amidase domain